MQFSSSIGTGILQRATFLTFGDSTSHITAYPLKDMVNAANTWNNRVGMWIWQATKDWDYDDSSYTTMPFATTTLVNDQDIYALPTTAIGIKYVEVMNSSGDYERLEPIDPNDLKTSFTEFEETDGMPRYYDMVGNIIRLRPAPATASVTLAAGLRIEFIREQNAFAIPATYTTDDTTEPGFDEAFHEIISYGIAHDYLIANKPALASAYYQRIELLRQDMSKHYGGKNKDVKLSVKPRVEDYQ